MNKILASLQLAGEMTILIVGAIIGLIVAGVWYLFLWLFGDENSFRRGGCSQ